VEIGPDTVTTDESLRENLRKMNERLELALDAAKMGVWEWNVVNNKVTWCQQIAAMTGVDARTSTFGDHRGLVHPDDREALFARLDRAANGNDDLSNLSFRFCRPGGGWRHMSGHALVERQPPQRATRIVVALTDASERCALEEALRQAQKVDHPRQTPPTNHVELGRTGPVRHKGVLREPGGSQFLNRPENCLEREPGF